MFWLNLYALPLLARICLVCMFPFSGIDKILHWDGALKQASSSFLPCAPCLLIMGMAIEFLTPICIVFAWHDHIAAFILAGYCAITAILFHNFWTYPDFWAKGESVGRNHFWDFTKNFCVAGGLLALIGTASFHSLQTLINHPLASAPVAATNE
jgi:putative oxidoreductase